MVGLPAVCQTKEDWENAVDYAKTHNEGLGEMKMRLINLRDNHWKMVLKESSKDVPAEEQTADDFERVDDPAAEKYRLGVADEWIDGLIEEVENV